MVYIFWRAINLYFIALSKKLGFPKYSVMGWSGGGCSALLAAIKHPETIRKLVVWGTFAYVDEHDTKIYEYFQQRKNRGGKMMEMLVDEYGDEFFDKHFGGWMKVFSRIYTNHGGEFVSKSLDKIKCSTLILHGSDDGLVSPKHGEYLNKNIKNSRLVKWEGGKHNLHLRYSDKFNRLVQDFLLEEQ
ncbi:Valacyclovir hydrolase [Folsomia candida]|uniref:Valacyclovir hydrolase n=1 Tax=Folsomia candida TaxID=158441 RepID=A0A226F5M2_FOLCA|nr:Valacyclovir hydrolase [Folsomia candida]